MLLGTPIASMLTDAAIVQTPQVVKEELAGKKFDEQEAKEWSLNIADTIRERVRQLNIPRYKVIVQVTIGQMLDQGVRVASRCLWDTATDNYAR
jgi:tctex1 domain-containing protein 2